jgi:sulfur carrier protein
LNDPAGPGAVTATARRNGQNGPMRIRLRNPNRVEDLPGPRSVMAVLEHFALNRESVLVIRNGTLVPGDDVLGDEDEVEIRPVISGGAA